MGCAGEAQRFRLYAGPKAKDRAGEKKAKVRSVADCVVPSYAFQGMAFAVAHRKRSW